MSGSRRGLGKWLYVDEIALNRQNFAFQCDSNLRHINLCI
jgi:hypothetical protein